MYSLLHVVEQLLQVESKLELPTQLMKLTSSEWELKK